MNRQRPALTAALHYPTRINTMTKLLLMLMMVGIFSGCGGDSPTEPTKEELLIGIWTKIHSSSGLSFSTCEYRDTGLSVCTGTGELFPEDEGLVYSNKWRIEDGFLYEISVVDDFAHRPWDMEWLDDDTILLTDTLYI